MKYSKLLNLGEILTNAPIHVIMRRPDHFPNYYPGTDIDLLVMNMDKMIYYLSSYLPNYTRYMVKAYEDPSGGYHETQVQIDHWAGPKQLDLKFDLYSSHISEEMTDEILATRMEVAHTNAGSWEEFFSIPQPMMDNLLKCWEYIHNKKAKYKEFAKYEPLLKPWL